MALPKAALAWSSGKDSAWALHALRTAGEVEVVTLLTTVNEAFGRVAMHAVRAELLRAQAAAAGLPCVEVPIPWPCPNGAYEAAMAKATAELVAAGVTRIAFGDLFLEDVRAYRVRQLAGSGLEPVFPLWGRDTAALAREMRDAGLRSVVTCVDPRRLARDFAGRDWDPGALPAGVDPCGERGEFHTFCHAGPMFARPLAIAVGEVVEREGFVFADVRPA